MTEFALSLVGAVSGTIQSLVMGSLVAIQMISSPKYTLAVFLLNETVQPASQRGPNPINAVSFSSLNRCACKGSLGIGKIPVCVDCISLLSGRETGIDNSAGRILISPFVL